MNNHSGDNTANSHGDLHSYNRQYYINSKETARLSDCLHESCPDCYGKGTKADGRLCIHMISCPCDRCTVKFSV